MTYGGGAVPFVKVVAQQELVQTKMKKGGGVTLPYGVAKC